MRRTVPSCAAAAFLLLSASLTACGSSGSGRAGNPSGQASQQIAFGVDMARRGLWSEALFRFHQADQLRPQSAHIQNNLAVAYEAYGDFDKALEHYKKGLQLDPGSRELRANYDRFNQFYQGFRPPQKDQARPTRPGDAAAMPSASEAPPRSLPQPPGKTGEPTDRPPVSPPARP